MDKNRVLLIILGIVNIVFGIFWLVIFSIPFLAAVLGGWVTDGKILNDLHWFQLYILDRISFTISFIFSILLVRAGFLLLFKKPNAGKLAIYSSIALILGEIIGFFSIYISTFVHNDKFFNILDSLAYIYLSFVIYLIMQLIYLSQPKIKEIFDDDKVKVGLIVPIIFCIVSFFMPQIGWAIKWLSGGYK